MQVTSQQALERLEQLKPGMDFVAVEELIHTVDIQRKGYITKNEYVLWVSLHIRVRVRACVRACGRACVRACGRACVRARVLACMMCVRVRVCVCVFVVSMGAFGCIEQNM